jgi:serine/threonine protein kinase
VLQGPASRSLRNAAKPEQPIGESHRAESAESESEPSVPKRVDHEDCMPLWWKDMKEGTERKKQRALARSERRQRATAGSEARLLPQPRGMTMGELPTFRTKSGEEDGDRKVGDDYDLGKVCGKGTSSIIRHATHMESGLEVVVKSCRKIQMNSLAWGTLLEGVKVHETLQHPRILRIEDLYVSPTKVDMVLTYLEGGHLQAELDRRGRFSEEQASYIIHQLLEVLDFLHEREIVHRDITLRNVMLQKKGELAVKVIDFNLAVEWNGFEKLTDQCGSVPFASPERVQGTYTEKADMWSVGVITHMLLTGQPVYHGSEREVLFKASQGRIDLSEKLQECSQGAQQFVRSLLTINPVLRMSAEEALSHPWL